LAILAKISKAFENPISECPHFQSLNATEDGGASYPAENAELISISLGIAQKQVERPERFPPQDGAEAGSS
jgi:hypothetical protein